MDVSSIVFPLPVSRRRWLRAIILAGAFCLVVGPANALAGPSARKMMLLADGKVIRTYQISLGANPKGHKRERGDERTPEGNYILDYRNSSSKFYKSIHISYPNAEDIAAARKRGVHPGGMIFIHGTPNEAPKNRVIQMLFKTVNWTDGCIAVSDRDMDEIWKLVRDGTPIRIDP